MRACVDDLTADRAFMISGTKKAKAKLGTLAICSSELEASEATHEEALGVVVPAVGTLRGLFAVGEGRANIAETGARKSLYKLFQLLKLVK